MADNENQRIMNKNENNMDSSNTSGRISKLRFPGFTGEWEIFKVSDLFKITRGYVLPVSETKDVPDTEYKYPVYSSQTADNGLMGYYKMALFKDAITWTTDGANAGTVRYRKGEFYCTNVCGVLINNEGYANLCVAEILGRVSKNYVSFVGNPKLMNNVMAEIPICIPPTFAEQQKIASCLSELDNLITVQGQKVDALKEKKKGLMQQLFPQKGEMVPRLRFPGFIGEWEEKRLGEIGDVCMCKRIMKHETTPTGPIPFYKIGTFGKKADAFIQEKLFLEYKKKYSYPKKGDILFSAAGTIGRCVVFNGEPAYFQDSNIVWIANDESIVYNSFLKYIYTFIDWKIDDGGIVKRLYNESIRKTSFYTPSLLEQQKIAECLSALDETIAAESDKLEALKNHKKGLMQQLFPQPAK